MNVYGVLAVFRWDKGLTRPVRVNLDTRSDSRLFDLTFPQAERLITQVRVAINQAERAERRSETNGCDHADYCKCPDDKPATKETQETMSVTRINAYFTSPPVNPDRPVFFKQSTYCWSGASQYLSLAEAEAFRDELDEKIKEAKAYAAANPTIITVEDLKPGDKFEEPDGSQLTVGWSAPIRTDRYNPSWNKMIEVFTDENLWCDYPEKQPVRLISRGK